jgi:hypothetical protein
VGAVDGPLHVRERGAVGQPDGEGLGCLGEVGVEV